jgi:hypothetical protein
MLIAGGLSLRAIAAEPDARGIATKEGRPNWSHFVVSRLLNRPA